MACRLSIDQYHRSRYQHRDLANPFAHQVSAAATPSVTVALPHGSGSSDGVPIVYWPGRNGLLPPTWLVLEDVRFGDILIWTELDLAPAQA